MSQNNPDFASLFSRHLETVNTRILQAMAEIGIDTLVIGSGEHDYYFEDDQAIPFRTNGNFAWCCPLAGPHHFLKFSAGQKKPLLVCHTPEGFWYDTEQAPTSYWEASFEIVQAPSPQAAWQALGPLKAPSFLGTEVKHAQASGIPVNSEILRARMNWARSFKTDYEIQCISKSNELAARSHRAAKEAFFSGKSEFEIFRAYADAVGFTDEEFTFPCIVALDSKSAVLHYERKRKDVRNAKVALIDASAPFEKYGADVTRTHVLPTVHPAFRTMRDRLNQAQLELCDQVRPGVHMADLMRATHQKIAEILKEIGVIQSAANLESLVNQGLMGKFMPHGLGHMLGVFVHDVAGRVSNKYGDIARISPDAKYAQFGRTSRKLEEGNVTSMEPGIYFIPMLLKQLAESPEKSSFNWKLIEELKLCGGVRIEDDVLLTAQGHRNLTREFLPE